MRSLGTKSILPCLIFATCSDFVFTSTLLTINHEHNPCDTFRCENNGQCQTVMSEQTGKLKKHAECVCHDRWIGPHCEALLVLSPRRITDYSVELRVTLQNNTLSQKQHKQYLKYTLQYWTNERDTFCYKIPGITNITYEISDLTSGVYYYFCARTDIVDRCYTTVRDPNSLTSNCIGIVTQLPSNDNTNNAKNGIPVLPIVISVILILASLVAIIIVFKCSNTLLPSCGCSLSSLSKCWQQQHRPVYDLFVLPDNTYTNNQTPLILDSGQQQPQSLAMLIASPDSDHPTQFSFQLPSDLDMTEPNHERMTPLIPDINEDADENESSNYIGNL